MPTTEITRPHPLSDVSEVRRNGEVIGRIIRFGPGVATFDWLAGGEFVDGWQLGCVEDAEVAENILIQFEQSLILEALREGTI